jgi:hypothetical protein
MSLKLSSLGLFLAAAIALPACPFRKTSEGGGGGGPSDPTKPTGPEVGLVKPSGPVVMATGHPRLFVRDVDIPRLRSWATADNPIFERGLKPLVEQCAQTADGPTFLKDDPGTPCGFTQTPI